MTTIFTIGYEGADIDAFLATLGEAGIDHVVDVRDFPGSRKKGFSKKSLCESLNGVGVHQESPTLFKKNSFSIYSIMAMRWEFR
ncbi:DUF488 domain-containing protein [Altererythrobacter aquiaggeris]|uniref:DUF488 domain-containing protein n=1 Tax=Aestuarierythrobacter aquiaggeris TaxID=1898396 RepID=UPI00301949B7